MNDAKCSMNAYHYIYHLMLNNITPTFIFLGIVYTFSKKEADSVASSLRANGISAQSYHSDVRENKKDQIQNSWMRNKTQVVVATIAFGLGINKHDCRFVLHHSL